MSLKEKIENHLGIFFLSTLASGFGIGVTVGSVRQIVPAPSFIGRVSPAQEEARPEQPCAEDKLKEQLRLALAESATLRANNQELRSGRNNNFAEGSSGTRLGESVSAALVEPPPSGRVFGRQDFPEVRIEVSRLQVTAKGKISVFLTYTNLTEADLYVALCSGFCGNLNENTFVIDDVGNYYSFDSMSGMGTCCFGLSGDDPSGNPLLMPSQGTATATLFFRAPGEMESRGRFYSLSSQQLIGSLAVSGQWRQKRSINVTIQDMVPR